MPSKGNLYKSKIISAVVIFLIMGYTQFAMAQNYNVEEERRRRKEKAILVVFSAINETYSIFHPQNPVPYFGAGHFFQGKWQSGLVYMTGETSLLVAKHLLKAKVAKRDYIKYPNQSNLDTYYAVHGLNSRQYTYKVWSDAVNHTYYYFRMIDVFTAYRSYHNSFRNNSVKMDDTKVNSLAVSPFKLKYLTNAWVFAPALLTGAVALVSPYDGPSIQRAKKINMFGKQHTPLPALMLSSSMQTFRYGMTAIGEEMYFRGIIQTEITENTNPTLGVLLGAVMFGAFHIPQNGINNAAGASLGGLYLGYRYHKNGYDLGEVIAAHFWIDWLPQTIGFLKNPKGSQLIYSISWKL